MPILIALVLLGGSGLLGVAVGFPMLVPALMVIATTIWVHSDSERIDYPDGAVEAKVLLLWIIFFPHYLYKRREVLIANTVSQRIAEQKGTAMNSNTAATALSPGSAPNAERAERACPECGESVLAVARKCKHCGSAIEPVAADDVPQAAVAASPMPLGASLGRGSAAQADEEEEDKGSRKAFVGIAVAVVALGALLWFASSYEGDASSDAETASSNEPPAHAVGELITTSKLGITVTSVDTPDGVGIPFIRETPAEGGIYVAVQWEYENISAKPIGVFSQPKLYLADPAGTRYEADIGASSTYAMELDLTEKVMSDLNPGIKVRSASVFEVAQSLLNQPGWTIVIVADRTIRIPLAFGKPEPVAVAAAPSAIEEAAVEEPVAAEEPIAAEALAAPPYVGAWQSDGPLPEGEDAFTIRISESDGTLHAAYGSGGPFSESLRVVEGDRGLDLYFEDIEGSAAFNESFNAESKSNDAACKVRVASAQLIEDRLLVTTHEDPCGLMPGGSTVILARAPE